MTMKGVFAAVAAVVAVVSLVGCSSMPDTQAERNELHADVLEAIAEFKKTDPTITERFNTAYGYAVFPSVAKGGAGVGGAAGTGEVIREQRVLGYCRLSQATIGLQLGGQVYREVIFFENATALNHFTGGNFEFSAQASAVALKSGASANARYEDGVLVMTQAKGGLMYEASVGGQKFSFTPKEGN